MTQNGPRMTQNYPNWPKNDARIYALFPQFFLTEKVVPQTFSLLECMIVGAKYVFGIKSISDRYKQEIHSFLFISSAKQGG